MVDLYCERLGPELWAEPVNALTNLAFLVAAFAAGCSARSYNRLDPDAWVLIGLMASIGIGSGLFHTYATGWSRFLDVVPILAFQLIFLWRYARDVLRLPMMLPLVFGALLFSASIYFRRFPEVLNGSLIYAPGLCLLVALAILHYRQGFAERTLLSWAALVFMASISFRTMDLALCDQIPLGTHFLWHLLNGLLVYLVFRAWLMGTTARIMAARA